MNELIFNELINKGATIKNIDGTDIFVVNFKNKNHYFINNLNSGIPYILGLHLRSRTFMRRLLEISKSPFNPGESFNQKSLIFAFSYAKTIGFPVVISSDKSDLEEKIVASNQIQLENAFNYFSKKGRVYIEKLIEGDLYEVLIFKSGFLNILKINSTYIKGDGILSINEIINNENKRRINSTDPILKIDEKKLKISGLNLSQIVEKGKIIDIFVPIENFENYNGVYTKKLNQISKKVIKFFPHTSNLCFYLTHSNGLFLVGDFNLNYSQHLKYKVKKGNKKKLGYEEFVDDILSL